MRRDVSTVIVEERTLIREGLCSLLQGTPYRVVASVAEPTELENLELARTSPTLVLLGINGDIYNAIAIVTAFRQEMPQCKFAVIGEISCSVNIQRIMEMGVDACIFDIDSRDVFLQSLDLMLMDRKLIVSGRLANFSKKPDPAEASKNDTGAIQHLGKRFQLSHREQQILICLTRGDSNKSIARTCEISEGTVKAHLKTILRKIDVHNRTQAVVWAFENGLRVNHAAGSTPSIIPESKHFEIFSDFN